MISAKNADTLVWLGVAATFVYFIVAALLLRLPKKRGVQVVGYEPPAGISPGAAAWLLEGGELPRAIVATLLNLVAKGVLTVKRCDGTYEMQRVCTPTQPLLQEERALMYAWFRTGNALMLPAGMDEMKRGVDEFGKSIESYLNPTYYTKNSLLYFPVWIASGAIAALALFNGDIMASANPGGTLYILPFGFLGIWGCLIVVAHGLTRSLRKIATYLPGRDVPKTPLCKGDVLPLGLLALSFLGILLLAAVSSLNAALEVAVLLAINALFFRTLWGPTRAGREAIEHIHCYKKFLSEVDADPVSRVTWPDGTSLHMTAKIAYAVALGIDLGWGEQFVAAIENWVDSAAVVFSLPDMLDNPRDPFAEMDLK
jgi:hypothetical protein